MVMESSVQAYPGGRNNPRLKRLASTSAFGHQTARNGSSSAEIAQGSATFKSADQWYKAPTYCKKDTKQFMLKHDLAGHDFISRSEHLVD
jgi:hypothetical protein